MAFGEKYVPQFINMDLHETLMPANAARYIKNLVHSLDDTSTATTTEGGQTGVYKTMESNSIYVDDFTLPAGDNYTVGSYSFKETKEAFWFVYNSRGAHSIYRINGTARTIDTVYQKSTLNFQLKPEYFIAQTGCWLEVIYVTDPNTGKKRRRSFLFFTEGFNDQRSICTEDSIATKGFDPSIFPYFIGKYDPKILINMGVPSTNDCIEISEVPVTVTSEAVPNKLLFNTWQFRVRYYDVWGRPSEYSIISDMYIPASDCLSSSTGAARCLNLKFKAPAPHINQVEISYRNCNSTQWYKSDTLNLYDGSPLGDWWTRSRNASIDFDPVSEYITYQFCADRECDPISINDTDRLYNPLPKKSQALAKVDKYISLSHNIDGFNPFSETLKNNIKFTVEAPENQGPTQSTFRNVSILLEIVNFSSDFQNGPANGVIFYYPNNKNYYFQAIFTSPVTGANVDRIDHSYNQFFKNPNQQGFIGYFAGTNIYTISEQYSLDQNGIFEKVTDFSNFDLKTKKYFQKFTFSNINKGTYIFRIAGITVDPAIDSISTIFKSSTYVVGQFHLNVATPKTPVDHNLNNMISKNKELIIDVCDGDYDSIKKGSVLVIADFANTHSAVRQGYVLNTNDAIQDQYGIELLKLSGGWLSSYNTDHNGYFFAAFTVTTGPFGGPGHYYIQGYCDCKLVSFANNVSSDTGHQQYTDNYYLNASTVCTDYSSSICNYIVIKGSVLLCGSNIGVPGITVVLSRGSSAISGADGSFTIIAHDDVLNINRQDKLYFISNTCNFTDCDGGCLPQINVVIEKCVSCQAREIDVSSILVTSISLRGLLSGGVYPVGVGKWDWLKRTGFIDPLGYINIPTVQQTKLFAPSRVRVDIDPAAVFPDDVTDITFWIGTETTIAEYFTWIVDSVLFIDNTGLENKIAPTQIKIYYASLIEYNKQNNYNTTVNWNFLVANAANTSSSPYTNDKVEFLLNGDGTFFDKSVIALVKYDSTGQYFLINYTKDLANLLPNAIIRVVRPKQCTGTEPYYEVCSKVDIANGKATTNSFYLNAFDTYYLYREIPVPVPQAIIPPATTPTFINVVRALGVPFEHNSPSDFWGQGCANLGRVNIKNEQEIQLYKRDQIALSDALSVTGQLNFLCFFDDARKFDFSDTGINGITGVFPETGTILIIGASDHFIVGFNDNLLRVNQDGTAQAGSISDAFGKPQRKVSQNYGCLLFDKNTIYKKQGLVHWLDTTMGALVQHNYQIGIDISATSKFAPGGVESWLRPKIKSIQVFNLAGGPIRYWHGVVNPQNYEYILTDHTIGIKDSLNSLRSPDVTQNETMAVSIFSKLWKASYGFIPEYYTELEGELTSQQLISFINGKPYAHYNDINNKSYGQMYGQNLVRVLEPVVMMDGLRKKKPLAVGVICKESQYFVDRAINEGGQMTRMLLAAWLQAEFGWYAPFLADLNTPFDPNLPLQTGNNKLMDGNMLVGNYIKVRLIGDPSKDDIYSEFQGILISVIPDGNNLQTQ